MKINYVNLTNGIEALPKLQNYRFIRIQSTACEQHNWDCLIANLDSDFMMNLVLGNECQVYDFGSRGGEISRACWQGLEFVKWILNYRWLGKRTKTKGKACDMSGYFYEVWKGLGKKSRRKIDYFKKFLMTDEIKLTYVCEKTSHDGDLEFYKKILKNT